ncbi:MAG: hypothetical protein ACAI35_07520 [Candidatus Methylacidiphilales bacterium]
MRQRYMDRGKEGKSRLLDELCEQFGYSRKHAIKLMSGKVGWGGEATAKKGRPSRYGPDVVEVYKRLWRLAEQACGKRLVALRELWLPHYQKHYGKLGKDLRSQVLSISAAQIDRLLAPYKASSGARGKCGTRPGGLLKTHIPIRTDNWDISCPGYLEADTVAHCGTSLEGDFIWSVTYTDICSGWTCNRAVWNKGAEGIVAATREVEAALPFTLLGFDCDNGSEFLNWHLVRYFQERPSGKAVGFTRSRPYHKDDNGHVEQKNWTHVRQLLGYQRLEDPALLPAINALYRDVWEPLHNYFMPTSKLISKDRHGAKVRRRHDKPLTPCERLLASNSVTASAKRRLRSIRASLDPIALHHQLETGLRRILSTAPRSQPPAESSSRCNFALRAH